MMFAEPPHISWLRSWRRTSLDFEKIIRIRRVNSGRQQQIDFRDLESRDSDVELGLNVQEVLQLNGEDGFVPARIFGQLVVGKNIRSNLIFCKVLDTNRRNLFHSQEFGCLARPLPAIVLLLESISNG